MDEDIFEEQYASERILNIVTASRISPMSKYSFLPGRVFGRPMGDDRFKIVRLSGNTVFYKNMITGLVKHAQVEELIDAWQERDFVEIKGLDEIFNFLRTHLTPLLGLGLVAALIGWLTKKLD